jgi:hypothetical protein
MKYLKYLLIAAAVLTVSCTKVLTPQEHIAEARQFFDAGDYAAARIELLNAAR